MVIANRLVVVVNDETFGEVPNLARDDARRGAPIHPQSQRNAIERTPANPVKRD